MKESVSLFMAVLMIGLCLSGSCALADDVFMFRNGIQFGDSMGSVREKEKNTGNLSEDENHLRYSELKLSGIENSLLSYGFQNDSLVSITLSYDCSMSIGKAKSDYERINEGLIRKYGEPIEKEEDIKPFPGGLFERCEPIFTEPQISQQNIYGKNQWMIPIENGRTLVIEHMALSYSAFLTYVLHILEYQYIDVSRVNTYDIVDSDL